jgi:hypothetical protein
LEDALDDESPDRGEFETALNDYYRQKAKVDYIRPIVEGVA